MTRPFHRLLALLAIVLSSAAALQDRQPAGAEPATTPSTPAAPIQVLILGTYHFANPGRDLVKNEVADVMTEEKQAEIAAVAEALARFKPTKIAVEVTPESQAGLDDAYAAFRRGERELERNEREQLGFRLAAQLDLAGVRAIDEQHAFPVEPLMAWAAQNDPAAIQWLQATIGEMSAEAERLQHEKSVGEILRLYNDPAWLEEGHGLYLEMLRIGAGKTPEGADLVAAWYERNIRIFQNLQAVAEPGDRIIVIFGAGHAPLLRHLVESDPRMELVEALDHLPQPQ